MELITKTDDLIKSCAKLKSQTYIAVDTEFLRETTYWPKLCLVQIAGGDTEIIVDPLTDGLDLAPLLELMSDTNILKVFHAPRQDLEIFYRLMNQTLPAPVFDTQTAAMALGLGEQISYDGLVNALLGKNVDKSHRFTDWSRRPLSDNQLNYAIADVTHLRDLYPILMQKLEERGRTNWVDAEMAALIDANSFDTTPTNAWKRMRPKKYTPEYLAAFFAATTWREWFAQERDIPRSRALKDDAIFEIAEQKPRDADAMERMRAVPKGFGKSKGGIALLEALNEAMENPQEFAPKTTRPKPNPPGQGATIELLKVLLRAISEELEVSPRLIASSSDIEEIANSDSEENPIFHGWRRKVFGEIAIRLKKGEVGIAVKNRKVTIFDLN